MSGERDPKQSKWVGGRGRTVAAVDAGAGMAVGRGRGSSERRASPGGAGESLAESKRITTLGTIKIF